MFLRLVAIWGVLLCVLCGLVRAQNCSSPLFIIQTEANAQSFNACDVINGDVTIEFANYTTLLRLDRIKSINGTLTITDNQDDTLLSTSIGGLSMKSLEFVAGSLDIEKVSNLMTIDLSALSAVGETFSLRNLPRLNTISLSSLTTVGSLDFEYLTALERLSFDAGLSNVTGYPEPYTYDGDISPPPVYWVHEVSIINTPISSLDGLNFPEVSNFYFHDNPSVRDLTLGLTSIRWRLSYRGGQDLEITGNGQLNLSLPQLKSLNFSTSDFGGLSSLNIPVLEGMNGSVTFSGFTIKTLDAPSLQSIPGMLEISTGSGPTQINMPVLENVNSLRVSEVPAVSVEDGVWLPNLTYADDIYFGDDDQGNGPYCQVFNNYKCRGIIANYLCASYTGRSIGTSSARTCAITYPPYGWLLSKKLAVGLGISLPIVVGLIIYKCCRNYHRKAKRRAAAIAAPAYPSLIELTEELPKYEQHDASGGEHLPDYVAADAESSQTPPTLNVPPARELATRPQTPAVPHTPDLPHTSPAG